MGIISSFFGERPAAPQTGGFTQGAQIPEELAPYYKDILGKAQALYDARTAEGYQPYQGPTLAQFTPEQEQAFTGIAGLQGTTAPVFEEAMGLTREAAAPITTEQVEEYMNPYQQAVVDIEKREAQKQYESQVVPQLAARAATTGGFGGSRQAILEGMAADTQQRLLGDIQAKGSAQAYQDAVNRLQMERQAQGAAAGQLASMAPAQLKTQLGEIGAQQTVGEERQKLTQQALNEAYGQYLKEQEFPYQTMGRYQSVVTGAPIAQTQYIPPAPPPPSLANQLIGGLGTLGATYGAFGGFSPGGFMGMNNPKPAKTGGGIADLPVIKRQNSGSVYKGDPEFGLDDDLLNKIIKRYEPRSVFPFASLAEREPSPKTGQFGITQILKDIDRDPELQNVEVKKYTPKRVQKSDIDFISNLPRDSVVREAVIKSPRYRNIMDNLSGMIDPPPPAGSEVTNEDIQQVITETNTNITNEEKDPKEKELEDIQTQSNLLSQRYKEKFLNKKDEEVTPSTAMTDVTKAETALMNALKDRSDRIEGRIGTSRDREREAQFGNLALFFQRLAQKPTLVQGAIESAGEVLPTALKTKREFEIDRRSLEDKKEDVKIDTLKTDVKLKTARASLETKAKQTKFDNIIKQWETFGKLREADAKWLKANFPDIKIPRKIGPGDLVSAQGYMSNILENKTNFGNISKYITKHNPDLNTEGEIKGYIEDILKNDGIKSQVASRIEVRIQELASENKQITDREIKEITATVLKDVIKNNPKLTNTWARTADWIGF